MALPQKKELLSLKYEGYESNIMKLNIFAKSKTDASQNTRNITHSN